MNEVDLLQFNWLAMRMGNRGVRERLDRIRGVVFDLGCGKRPFEREILGRAQRYVGVDWPHTLHGMCADIAADLNDPLPIRDAAADTVLALSVLEHLREPEHLLREAFRIMKPGAFLYVAVPFQWWVHEAPQDYYRFTRFGLEYLLAKAGFERVEVQETSGFWAMWFLKLNYQTTRLLVGPAPLRGLIRACLLPLWFSTQVLAPLLDRLWPWPAETQGYNATAWKP